MNGDHEEIDGAPDVVEAALALARREDGYAVFETRRGDEIRINPHTVRALMAPRTGAASF